MKTWLKIALGLIILVIVGGALVFKFYINKPHQDIEKARPAISLRAKQLFTEYIQNKPLADQKFTGKVLEIEGTITRIEKTDDLVIVVYAYQRGDFGDEGIRVTMLPQFAEQAYKLSALAPVKIKGFCTGYNGADVILEKGSITSFGKDKPMSKPVKTKPSN
jgi:hypothetical protein